MKFDIRIFYSVPVPRSLRTIILVINKRSEIMVENAWVHQQFVGHMQVCSAQEVMENRIE